MNVFTVYNDYWGDKQRTIASEAPSTSFFSFSWPALPPVFFSSRLWITTAVDRRSDSIHSGGPTRSSADFSVPRRCYGAERVFPYHLITLLDELHPSRCVLITRTWRVERPRSERSYVVGVQYHLVWSDSLLPHLPSLGTDGSVPCTPPCRLLLDPVLRLLRRNSYVTALSTRVAA